MSNSLSRDEEVTGRVDHVYVVGVKRWVCILVYFSNPHISILPVCIYVYHVGVVPEEARKGPGASALSCRAIVIALS